MIQEQSNLLRCIYPWTKFEIHENGSVWFCCPAWINRSIGNIQKENIEQIWNGPIAQEVRKKIIENKLEDVCSGTCHQMVSNQYIDLAKTSNNNLDRTEISEFLFQEIKERKTIIRSWPSVYLLSNWGICNFRCIMCSANHFGEKPSYTDKMIEDILAHSGNGTKIVLTTNGEPFVREDAMQLMGLLTIVRSIQRYCFVSILMAAFLIRSTGT